MQRLNVARLPWIILLLGLIAYGAVACNNSGQVEPSPIPPTPTSKVLASPILPTATLPQPTALPLPEGDLGGVRGVIVAYPPRWDGRAIYVYFAPFYEGTNEGEGFYVLEPSVHPVAEVGADGTFQLNDISPARYVVLAGPAPEEALAVSEGGQPKVIEIVAGEVLDLGDIRLEE